MSAMLSRLPGRAAPKSVPLRRNRRPAPVTAVVLRKPRRLRGCFSECMRIERGLGLRKSLRAQLPVTVEEAGELRRARLFVEHGVVAEARVEQPVDVVEFLDGKRVAGV